MLSRERIAEIRSQNADLHEHRAQWRAALTREEAVALCDQAASACPPPEGVEVAHRIVQEREGIIASIRATSWSGTEEIVTMIRARAIDGKAPPERLSAPPVSAEVAETIGQLMRLTIKIDDLHGHGNSPSSILLRQAVGLLRRLSAARAPLPEFRTFTLDRECVICGVRYESGTYQIGRVVEPVNDEPAF